MPPVGTEVFVQTITLPGTVGAIRYYPFHMAFDGDGVGSVTGDLFFSQDGINPSSPAPVPTTGPPWFGCWSFGLQLRIAPTSGGGCFWSALVAAERTVDVHMHDVSNVHFGSSTTDMAGDEGHFTASVDMDCFATSWVDVTWLDPGTYSVYMYNDASFIVPQFVAFPTPQTTCVQGHSHVLDTFTGVTITFRGIPVGEPEPTPPYGAAAPDVAADMRDNIIAVTWIDHVGDQWVSVCRSPEKGIGQDVGDQGFSAPVKLLTGSRQGVTCSFLPSHRLLVSGWIPPFGGGSGPFTTGLMLNQKHGSGTLSDWVSVNTATGLGRSTDDSRQQATVYFTGGGGWLEPDGEPYTFGNTMFAALWDEKHALESGGVMGGAGASCNITSQTRYVGGAWLDTEYGVLVTFPNLDDPPNGHIKWQTTKNLTVWPAAEAALDTGKTGQVGSLARTSSKALCALVWDFVMPGSGIPVGTKTSKAMRSRDAGKTWEMDEDPVPQIPAVFIPPVLVCEEAIIFCVWIDRHRITADGTLDDDGINLPAFATSFDAGKTWIGPGDLFAPETPEEGSSDFMIMAGGSGGF